MNEYEDAVQEYIDLKREYGSRSDASDSQEPSLPKRAGDSGRASVSELHLDPDESVGSEAFTDSEVSFDSEMIEDHRAEVLRLAREIKEEFLGGSELRGDDAQHPLSSQYMTRRSLIFADPDEHWADLGPDELKGLFAEAKQGVEEKVREEVTDPLVAELKSSTTIKHGEIIAYSDGSKHVSIQEAPLERLENIRNTMALAKDSHLRSIDGFLYTKTNYPKKWHWNHALSWWGGVDRLDKFSGAKGIVQNEITRSLRLMGLDKASAKERAKEIMEPYMQNSNALQRQDLEEIIGSLKEIRLVQGQVLTRLNQASRARNGAGVDVLSFEACTRPGADREIFQQYLRCRRKGDQLEELDTVTELRHQLTELAHQYQNHLQNPFAGKLSVMYNAKKLARQIGERYGVWLPVALRPDLDDVDDERYLELISRFEDDPTRMSFDNLAEFMGLVERHEELQRDYVAGLHHEFMEDCRAKAACKLAAEPSAAGEQVVCRGFRDRMTSPRRQGRFESAPVHRDG